MKKFLAVVLIAVVVFILASTGYCAENPWGRTDTNRLLGKVMPGYLQAAGTSFGGSTSMTTSETAVPLTYSVVFKEISKDAHAGDGSNLGTLANGTKGQLLKIYITGIEDAGSGTWTLTPTTMTGFTSLAFNAARDEVTLLYVDSTTGWILISSTSVTVGLAY